MKFLLFLLLLATPEKIHVLYSTLDLSSISQHLAFATLYPESPEGHLALEHAWKLMSGPFYKAVPAQIPLQTLSRLVALVNQTGGGELEPLPSSILQMIEQTAQTLPNRQLAGYRAQTLAEVIALPPEQIDLARGLFLSELGEDKWPLLKTYEAQLDLMALQIKARLKTNASLFEKVAAINAFVFDEMGFRFPPHSAYAKDIDLYTFLPSVLDSRRGVCLGVSILYICLAQRLDLSLEMVTPPGHIFVRCPTPQGPINIETTARGVHLESEVYLGIDTPSLEQRNVKEVIGLAHFNQASVYLQKEDYAQAVTCYARAEPFLPDDFLLQMLSSFSMILSDQETAARPRLEKLREVKPPHSLAPESMIADYLDGYVGKEGLEAFFKPVDEDRISIEKKKALLEDVVQRHPRFRSGLMALATCWLQLHREGEGLDILLRLDQIESQDATLQYYLAVLHAQRIDYPRAWHHYQKTHALLTQVNHNPRALRDFKRELSLLSPE